MEFGISWGRGGDVKHEAYKEYLEVPEGMVRVPGAYRASLINESRYLLLRLVKTILALAFFGSALVLVCFATVGGLMSLFDGFNGQGMLGPIALLWVPVAFVSSYAMASIAVLCTEKYTRQTDAPGVVEIVCPACKKETPLFKKCAECGVGFIFASDPNDGILIGLLHIINWLLSAFWFVICAVGFTTLLVGML